MTGGASPPVVLDRDEARDLAQRELADPEYQGEEPSLLERVVDWVLDRLAALLDAAAGSDLAGRAWVLALVALVALGVVVLVRSRGLPGLRAAPAAAVLDDPTVPAAEHRRRADEAAAAGDWATALTFRFRALVRGAEERLIVDARPGRTADEASRELGRLVPDAADDLARAATLFDGVRFGGRSATPAEHALVRGLDETVARARPADSAGRPDAMAPR